MLTNDSSLDCMDSSEVKTFAQESEEIGFERIGKLMEAFIPSLSWISILLNAVIILVLFQSGTRDPSNVALIASTFANLITSLIALIRFSIESIIVERDDNNCNWLRLVKSVRILIVGVQASSNWITVLLALQRYFLLTSREISDQQ